MMIVGWITFGLFLICSVLLWLSLKLQRAEQKNQQLKMQNQQQAVEINTKNTEIKYAQIKQKNTDKASLSKLSTIDQQLHHHNWFRDEDSGNGLSSVSKNLSKPSRHDGNETSDSGTQPDASGDL